MKARILEQTLVIGQSEYSIETMDTKEIEDFFAKNIKSYMDDSPIVNEAFIKYAHLLKASEYLVKENGVKSVASKKGNRVLLSCVADAIDRRKCPIIKRLFSFIYQRFMVLGTFLFLTFKVLRGKKVERKADQYEGFFVCRTKAGRKMINVLSEQPVLQLFDTYNDKGSFYLCFSKLERFKILCKALVSANSILNGYCDHIKQKYGANCSNDARRYYSIRVVQTSAYELFVDRIAAEFKGKRYYTAENLDRFALIQERIAKKHNNTLVCIPHGIEYGFMLPHCFTGDIFYTTSEYSAVYLNKKYNCNKFLFDNSIAKKMFYVSHSLIPGKKFVFFTESREPYINVRIIQAILPVFKKHTVTLYLKFHPADDLKNYSAIIDDVVVVNDFIEAISNSYCIARKSTVLIEALYNDSDSIAILENNKDREIFESFPSLSDARINRYDSVESLSAGLEELFRVVGEKTV
ncbi:hypothetical protein [Ruminococcus sp. FC2018]|uniref:hypothetical protein n=1 Tax=Ruminococcus sp. FC2018 TaxID=1410617 RepID=UPI00048CA0EF|nr:hypothetical protein [Ruminococcus sp. FC2018]